MLKSISIEYCGTCNYRPMAAGLAMAIKTATGIEAELIHSRDIGAFEVKADGKLIFSKKQSGRFPDETEILDIIRSLEKQ
jgi:selenoprotein W-related protein